MLNDPWVVSDQTPVNLDNIKVHHYCYLQCLYKLNRYTVEEELLRKKKNLAENGLRRLEYIQQFREHVVRQAHEVLIKVLTIRLAVTKLYNTDEKYRKIVDERCKTDMVFWIDTFGYTFDPRLTNIGLPAECSMIMWPAQEELVKKIETNYKAGRGLLVEKSRAWGVTDLCCFFAVHHWMYKEGFQAGFGSQKADKVDSRNDPDAIFPRLRRILYSLPEMMRPMPFKDRKNEYDTEMKIFNPLNGSILKGDAGDAIGTGGRSSIYFVDEKALIEHPELVDTAISYNTQCQVDVSTPRGMNAFWKKKNSGRVDVFSCWWYHDPAKSVLWKEGRRPDQTIKKEKSYWRELQGLMFDDVIVAQEIDIDYSASVEDAFIKAEWVQAAIGFKLRVDGEAVAGFDVATGGPNKSVYISRRGPVVTTIESYTYDKVVQALWKAIEQGEREEIGSFIYDHAGIGESVESMLIATDRPIKFPCTGVYGQVAAPDAFIPELNRKGNEVFRNLRAYLAWTLARRFEKTYEHTKKIRSYPAEELISIPDDPELINQLSIPRKIHTTSGKIGVQSKDDMRSLGIPSPDHFDALMYAFADTEYNTVVKTFDYSNDRHFKSETIDFSTSAPGAGYVSIYQSDDLKTNALCAFWKPYEAKLVISEERLVANPDPVALVAEINGIMHAETYGVKEWIANDQMMPKDSVTTPWYYYKKAGVTLHYSYFNDPRGSIMCLERMFDRNAIIINKTCVNLVAQLSSWKMKKGEPDKALGLAWALAQLVSQIRKKDPVYFHKFEKQYGKNIPMEKETVER